MDLSVKWANYQNDIAEGRTAQTDLTQEEMLQMIKIARETD